MSDQEIRVGDTVSLRSGGPVMTVAAIYEDNTVVCIWFDNDVKNVEELPAETLNLVPAEDIPPYRARR